MGTEITFNINGTVFKRLQKLDGNGDFYDDNEDYNIDEDEDLIEDGLCRNEL